VYLAPLKANAHERRYESVHTKYALGKLFALIFRRSSRITLMQTRTISWYCIFLEVITFQDTLCFCIN
jgi:hypothetical protein